MSGSNENSTDYVILGAGIMGASIAFHLARRDLTKVIVIEKDHAGQGASGRSSALIRMHYCFPPEVQLAVKSLEIFQHWKEIVGEPTEFRKTGFVRIVPRQEFELLRANVAMQRKLGASAEVIEIADLKKMEPDWNLDDEPAAAYEPNGGYGDALIATQDLLNASRAMGVEYRPRTRATKLLISGDKVVGVATDKGEIYAPNVVVATGQWTKPLLQTAGIDVPIVTEFHQVAILRNPPGMKGGGAACIDSAKTLYFRSDAQDKTLVGDFFGKKEVDPDNFPQRPTADWLEKILDIASQRVPKLQNADIMRGITGVYDVSPDYRPLLGEIRGVRGLYVVAGFSGMGFKISPAIGLVMAELLLDGEGKTVDISAFRPSRFEEGQPIKAEFEYQNE
jgi:sarcosine oxidase, subunit beta